MFYIVETLIGTSYEWEASKLHRVHKEIQKGKQGGKQFMNTGSDSLELQREKEEITPSLSDLYFPAYKNSTRKDKYHGAPAISVRYPDLDS